MTIIRDLIFNQTIDVYIFALIWAILLFCLTLDCLIYSINQDRREEKRKRGWL